MRFRQIAFLKGRAGGLAPARGRLPARGPVIRAGSADDAHLSHRLTCPSAFLGTPHCGLRPVASVCSGPLLSFGRFGLFDPCRLPQILCMLMMTLLTFCIC